MPEKRFCLFSTAYRVLGVNFLKYVFLGYAIRIDWFIQIKRKDRQTQGNAKQDLSHNVLKVFTGQAKLPSGTIAGESLPVPTGQIV
jgi:hypothetical protein